jgi:glutaredoxin
MIVRLLFACALSATLLAGSASAGIYRWVDAEGRIVYSDSPPRQGNTKPVKLETNVVAPAAPPEPKTAAVQGERVKLYTTTWCGYCKKARAYLRSRNIPFDDIDVETTDRGRREYREIGGNGVPVIFVGERRMDGYDQGGLQDMLKAAGW